ncbi:sushi, von Willebrand factor type A, EGF and pentraxin domain-containing protein 1 [Exaiptasia diaphana]|uniref:Uncharacterized protein n=1 Tax=Exaiptasia diaphana TaxID=2652724 RepID=A0A913Y6Q3_EXADI|nr:sushi, von Willebrand factor type A, EGF and pentraxin domain-containing protein 1 [Exaiptasia diaphana]
MDLNPDLKYLFWVLLHLFSPIKSESNTEVIQFDASNFSYFMHDELKTGLKYGNFVEMNGKRLKMNAFKVVPFVKQKTQCIKECLSEENCKSINVAEVDSEAEFKYDCHLLDSHIFDPAHYKEIEDAPKHDHFTVMTECLSGACDNGGTCHPNYTQNTYTCNCTRQYSGNRCEREFCPVECFNSSGCKNYRSFLNYPTRSTDQNASIPRLFDQPIKEFTVSLWVQINNSEIQLIEGVNPAFFSFIDNGNTDELVVFVAGKEKEIWIEFQGIGGFSKFNTRDMKMFDGRWHHVAVTWSGTAFKFYLDGNSCESLGQRNFEERSLKANLRFALGQEQDDFNYGGYALDTSYQGNITGFHMYKREFQEKEILELSNRCPFEIQGDLIKWSDILPRRSSSINLFCGALESDDLPLQNGKACLGLCKFCP